MKGRSRKTERPFFIYSSPTLPDPSSLLLAYRLALVFRTTVEDLYCLAENKEQEDRENEEWT